VILSDRDIKARLREGSLVIEGIEPEGPGDPTRVSASDNLDSATAGIEVI